MQPVHLDVYFVRTGFVNPPPQLVGAIANIRAATLERIVVHNAARHASATLHAQIAHFVARMQSQQAAFSSGLVLALLTLVVRVTVLATLSWSCSPC